jgi:hypothetical protein
MPSIKPSFLALMLWLMPFLGYAFGVDICFKREAFGNIRNCIEVKHDCRTAHLSYTRSVTCRLSALIDSLKGLTRFNKIIGGRSLVHSDSTYFLAQLMGFTPWQAYQIMIYNEATDQSKYTPFDEKGEPLLSEGQIASCRAHWGLKMASECLITTPLLKGIGKFSPSTGGSFLHLHARYTPANHPISALPYPFDYATVDHLLTNFRAWLYEQRTDACIAGITKKMSKMDSPCASSTQTLTSPVDIAIFGFYKMTRTLVTHLGVLIIQKREQDTVYATNDSFQHYIEPHDIKLAKLGIYLHALADRYSHHLCVDHSYFYPDKKGNYQTHFSRKYCAQGSHFLWHVWEQGTNQSTQNLDIPHQTIRPALNAVYDELLAYAKYRSIVPKTPLPNKQELIDQLVTVLQIEDPKARLNEMEKLMEKYHTLLLPGHGEEKNESIEAWLKKAKAIL